MINKIVALYRKLFWSNLEYAKYVGVSIGNNCEVYTRNFGSEPYLITIGNNVQLASDVRFFTHGAAWVFRTEYPNCDFFGKIVIKDNVYVGSMSLILPGVTIGNNVIVGAGSVVTKSIPDNSIVGGNPAKVIGKVDELFDRIKEFDVSTKGLSYKKKRNLLMSLGKEKFLTK